MLKSSILVALGAAALIAPQTSQAQSYYGGRYEQPYRAQDYGQPRGDYSDRSRSVRFNGYPEFRGLEAHIRGEIFQAVRDDEIEREDARDLMNQLRDIQMQEAREYRIHGWRLPDDDRYRIRSRLDQLDALVDQTRQEQ